uniref:Phosphoglycolate phosphatase n=1 Tax=Malurus cyaneus samueli TaxID=2593467 RepID=A0A8C5UGF3_9PASS
PAATCGRRCRRLEGEVARAVRQRRHAALRLRRRPVAGRGGVSGAGRWAAGGGGQAAVLRDNNSGRTRVAYTEKLRRLGFPPPSPGAAAAPPPTCWAAPLAPSWRPWVPHLGPGPRRLPGPAPADWVQAPLDPAVRAVLVGFDEHFSYAKLCQALRYLLRGGPDCLLVGTNRDHRLPLEGGAAIPGTGCLVKAVETAAQREAFIVGKPNRFMFDCVASEFDVDPARTIMVGDRLDTDILMGNNCGLTTLLTLTGVTALDEVRGHQDSDSPARHSLVPDYYVDSIADLLPVLGE